MARPRPVEAPVTQPLNRRFVRAGRPPGTATAANARPEEAPNPEPGEGEALVRVTHPLEAAS